jgi:hypothetical protein
MDTSEGEVGVGAVGTARARQNGGRDHEHRCPPPPHVRLQPYLSFWFPYPRWATDFMTAVGRPGSLTLRPTQKRGKGGNGHLSSGHRQATT